MDQRKKCADICDVAQAGLHTGFEARGGQIELPKILGGATQYGSL